MCKESNISFISHDESTDSIKHFNESKLHLNSNGIKIFAESFPRLLVKLNWSQQRKTNFNTSISLELDKKSHSCEAANKGSTKSAQTDDPKEIFKNHKLKNVNRLTCAKLNIRYKSDSLVHLINNNIDVLMISETKLDPSFPTEQFHIHSFPELYKFDKDGNGGGMHLYIRDDIPSKVILTKVTTEACFVEINLRKKIGSFAAHITQKRPRYQNIWTKLAIILICCNLNVIILCW